MTKNVNDLAANPGASGKRNGVPRLRSLRQVAPGPAGSESLSDPFDSRTRSGQASWPDAEKSSRKLCYGRFSRREWRWAKIIYAGARSRGAGHSLIHTSSTRHRPHAYLRAGLTGVENLELRDSPKGRFLREIRGLTRFLRIIGNHFRMSSGSATH